MTKNIVVKTPNFDNVPDLLRDQNRWILWSAKPNPNGGIKYSKLPIDFRTGLAHSAFDPDIWLSFNDVRKEYEKKQFSGIGYVLTGDVITTDNEGNNLYVIGIDLDKCFKKDTKGVLTLNTSIQIELRGLQGFYWEVSPSGTGLRGFTLSRELLTNHNINGREIYVNKRFLTITGQTNCDKEITENTENIKKLYQRWFPDKHTSISLNGCNKLLNIATKTQHPEDLNEIGTVEQMLLHITADYGYDPYYKIIWAIASLGWKCGYSIANSWSKSAKVQHFDEDLLNQLWRDYRPDHDNSIGYGTLVYFAKLGGWNPDSSILTSKKLNSDSISDPIPDEIRKLNKQFAWVTSEMNLYNIDLGMFADKNKFLTQFSNQFIVYGKTSVPLGRAWLQSKYRRDASRVEMLPGKPSELPDGTINSWKGFSCKPVQGDVNKFTSLITHLIPDERDRKYALIWLARMIQNPAERFHVALTIWSSRQGSGKSLFFETLGMLFNERHHAIAGQEIFNDSFTDWMIDKVFIIADEVSAVNSYAVADKIKMWITSSRNKINPKGLAKYDQPNAIKYVFLSNHPNAVRITKDDRRFYIIEATNTVLPDTQAQEFVNWRDNEEGLCNILYYLQNEVDTSRFNPKAPAPKNNAKNEMIEDNRSDLERWVHTLTDAENIESLLGRELVTADELCERYNFEKGGRKEITSTAMTRTLRIAGIHRVEKQARRKNGIRPRVYALANIEKYGSMTDVQLGSVLDNNKFKMG